MSVFGLSLTFEALPVQDPDAPLLGGSEVLGWLAVYVDDILASGVEDHRPRHHPGGELLSGHARRPERVGYDAKHTCEVSGGWSCTGLLITSWL